MSTLTSDQLAYLRAKSGDDCTPYVVSDVLMQTYFDTAGDSLPLTIVSVLEDRWAAARAEAGKLTDFGTAVDTANIDHIKNLLDYWRAAAGVISLGSDTTYPYRVDSDQTSDVDYAES